MIHILFGLLLISVAVNIYFFQKIKKLRKQIASQTNALTEHVVDADNTIDELTS